MSKQIINKCKLIYLDPIEKVVLSNGISEIAGVLNDDDHLLLDSLSIDAGVFAYMFENKIMLPVALYAEMLWSPETNSEELIEQVAQYPCVEFSNINL